MTSPKTRYLGASMANGQHAFLSSGLLYLLFFIFPIDLVARKESVYCTYLYHILNRFRGANRVALLYFFFFCHSLNRSRGAKRFALPYSRVYHIPNSSPDEKRVALLYLPLSHRQIALCLFRGGRLKLL